MNFVCGIYGFHITEAIDLGDIYIEPRTLDHCQAIKWSRDLDSYHLTASITLKSIDDDCLFNLEAVLTFIEHLDVMLSQPIKISSTDQSLPLQTVIRGHRRINGGGAVVGEDALFPGSRSYFIQKAMEKLADKDFCETTQFKILFFKYVETLRLRMPFLDISYFLLFSGLESYSRSLLKDRTTKSASEPICKMLKGLGFDVEIEFPSDRRRAISTYTHLRNAVFHNSEIEKDIRCNIENVNLKLVDFSSHFARLVSLVMLKAVGFDDNHINWNSWLDRNQFK